MCAKSCWPMVGWGMSNYTWEPNPEQTVWHYHNKHGYSWGSVAAISTETYGVFVRHEFREPLKWVAHVDNLEDAKALVQTLVGANHV